MEADLSLTLPSDASAPAVARAAARRCLAGKVSLELLSELALVVSELVSNAFQHGRGQVVLRLQLDEDMVRGEVIDQGGGFEHEIRARGPRDLRGRGLFLVAALTTRWGIHEGTTHVWFEFAAGTDAAGMRARDWAKARVLQRETEKTAAHRRIAPPAEGVATGTFRHLRYPLGTRARTPK